MPTLPSLLIFGSCPHQAVASIMGLPAPLVRKTEAKALNALRRPHFLTRLEEFLDVDL